MSPRYWKDRIRDILDAIAEIQKFTKGMDFETFKDDDKSVRAVEMNFIILNSSLCLPALSKSSSAISSPCGTRIPMSGHKP